MVKYVPDRTGRFSQRPHYAPKELDRECENIIAGFLKERHGAAKYPASTDDLTVLIERDTESLDQANRLLRPVDSGQLNREHPFLFAQLQSSNDGTIVIGSGGRRSCELCHLNSPRGLAINQGYSTLAAARPHRIFTQAAF
jgi:hypothetical protein